MKPHAASGSRKPRPIGALIPFEPWSNATHNAKLQVKLDKWINEDQSRSGLVLAGFDRDDPDGPFALLSKPQDVDVVKTLSGDRKVVALSASQRVASSAAARKVAAYYEDQFGGNWRMTEFRPYEGEAVFEPLDGKVATARRGLLASNGFKCEPWDIYVSKRRGGGFKCPECGNSDPSKCNVTKRTCGYLGNPVQRPMVHGRHEEIAHRVKHMSGETGHVILSDGSTRDWYEETK